MPTPREFEFICDYCKRWTLVTFHRLPGFARYICKDCKGVK